MNATSDYGFDLGVECAWPDGWDPGREVDWPPNLRTPAAAEVTQTLLARLAGGFAVIVPPLPTP